MERVRTASPLSKDLAWCELSVRRSSRDAGEQNFEFFAFPDVLRGLVSMSMAFCQRLLAKAGDRFEGAWRW